MRLGVELDLGDKDPEEMARAYLEAGYSAAVCPPVSLAELERVAAIREAFAKYDIMLAEVGVWNNLLDPDETQRAANLQANMDKLALAEEIGARCCVNIAGSFNPERWDGPHPRNLSEEAFELTVQNARQIIDAVKPERTVFSLESMPWTLPDSVDSYLRLIEAIDRPQFGVHLDPVNMINCPARYYDNAGFLRDCFARLGPWLVSCHAKDTLIGEPYTVHLDEVRPGLGVLDYGVFLIELNKLPGDIPLILEHLPQAEYAPAREYVLDVAEELGLSFYQPQI